MSHSINCTLLILVLRSVHLNKTICFVVSYYVACDLVSLNRIFCLNLCSRYQRRESRYQGNNVLLKFPIIFTPWIFLIEFLSTLPPYGYDVLTTFQTAVLSDAGEYRCEAYNVFGLETASARLIVRRKTVIEWKPMDLEVRSFFLLIVSSLQRQFRFHRELDRCFYRTPTVVSTGPLPLFLQDPPPLFLVHPTPTARERTRQAEPSCSGPLERTLHQSTHPPILL